MTTTSSLATTAIRTSEFTARRTAFTGTGDDSQPQGRWNAKLTGLYTGDQDSTFDIRISSDTGSPWATPPQYLTGGGGNFKLHSVEPGSINQDVTVTLQDLGIQTTPAELAVPGGYLLSRFPGSFGNNVEIVVQPLALGTATSAATLEDINTGTQRLVGAQWGSLGALPLTSTGELKEGTPRISFGDDPEIYYPYLGTGSQSTTNLEIFLDKPIVRKVSAGSLIRKHVGSTYSIEVINNATLYTEIPVGIITWYDFLRWAKTESRLLTYSGSLLSLKIPGEMAGTEFSLRTTAFLLSTTTDIADDTVSPLLPTGVSVVSTADTESIVAEIQTEQQAKNNEWIVTGSASGALGTATTGQAFSAGPISFTLPTKPVTEAEDAEELDDVYISSTAFAARTADAVEYPIAEMRSYALGESAKKKTFTFEFRLRPSDDCDPSNVSISEVIDTTCLGADVKVIAVSSEEATGMSAVPAAIQTQYAALMEWVYTANAINEAPTEVDIVVSSNQAVDKLIRRRIRDDFITALYAADQQSSSATISELGTMIGGLNSNPAIVDWAGELRLGNTFAGEDLRKIIQDQINDIFAGNNLTIPFGSSGDSVSGGGCWTDYGDSEWWVVTDDKGRSYRPMFTNKPWVSAVMSLDKTVSTKEVGFIIAIGCANLLSTGDKIVVQVLGGVITATAYSVGDKFTFNIIGGMEGVLSGGIDGNNTLTWSVQSTDVATDDTVNLPNYSQVQNDNIVPPIKPLAYSAAGGVGQDFDFTITTSAPQFVIGDQFKFSIRSGQFQWRQNAGSWSAGLPLQPTLLTDGISVEFDIGRLPGVVVDDQMTFFVEQLYAVDHLTLPTTETFDPGGPAILTIGWDSAVTIDAVAIPAHTLPTGRSFDIVVGTETINATAYRGAMVFPLAAPQTVTLMQITLNTATAGEALRYLWVGEMINFTYHPQDLNITPQHYVATGTVPNSRQRLLGTGYGGQINWTYSDGTMWLDRDDVTILEDIFFDAADAVTVIPNINVPTKSYFMRLNKAQLPLIHSGAYSDDPTDPDQYYSAQLSFNPIFA